MLFQATKIAGLIFLILTQLFHSALEETKELRDAKCRCFVSGAWKDHSWNYGISAQPQKHRVQRQREGGNQKKKTQLECQCLLEKLVRFMSRDLHKASIYLIYNVWSQAEPQLAAIQESEQRGHLCASHCQSLKTQLFRNETCLLPCRTPTQNQEQTQYELTESCAEQPGRGE